MREEVECVVSDNKVILIPIVTVLNTTCAIFDSTVGESVGGVDENGVRSEGEDVG